MSPLASSLLGHTRYAPTPGSPESVDLLVDSLLCSADPTVLAVEPHVVLGNAAQPAAEVRISLNGLTWTITAVQALTASGRLTQTQTPFVARRQAYRLCATALAEAARTASVNALAARHRGAH